MLCESDVGFFFQAEDGIRDLVRSRGLGDVYKRQAIGRPQMIRGDWLKPGAVVIDVGINRIEDASKKLSLIHI